MLTRSPIRFPLLPLVKLAAEWAREDEGKPGALTEDEHFNGFMKALCKGEFEDPRGNTCVYHQDLDGKWHPFGRLQLLVAMQTLPPCVQGYAECAVLLDAALPYFESRDVTRLGSTQRIQWEVLENADWSAMRSQPQSDDPGFAELYLDRLAIERDALEEWLYARPLTTIARSLASPFLSRPDFEPDGYVWFLDAIMRVGGIVIPNWTGDLAQFDAARQHTRRWLFSGALVAFRLSKDGSLLKVNRRRWGDEGFWKSAHRGWVKEERGICPLFIKAAAMDRLLSAHSQSREAVPAAKAAIDELPTSADDDDEGEPDNGSKRLVDQIREFMELRHKDIPEGHKHPSREADRNAAKPEFGKHKGWTKIVDSLHAELVPRSQQHVGRPRKNPRN